jgi:pimeloyl-ACP methyl ester carboxylesterase
MSYLANFHLHVTGPQADAASAPKLVFLHGVMGFAANWRRIARAFENEYQVLTYDQRGHGRSFHPAVGYSATDYADDLGKILDELKWDKITLVGHSMGGRAAYDFASRFPQRVTRLVIEDIGPNMHPTNASLVTRMLDVVPVPFPSKREAKHWFDTRFMELFHDEGRKEALAAYLYANITENEKREAVWRFFEPGIRESIEQGRAMNGWEEIQSLSMPTLLIRGEFSRDLPRDLFDRMLAENPVIKGVEIPDSGHWIHSDQPELFIDALRTFFAK